MKRLMLIAAIAAAGVMFSVAENPQPQSSQHATQQGSRSTSGDDAGEKRFQTHCARCHQLPEEIPPAAASAVVRHMRVRAMLTHEDEQLILHFIAPR